MVVNLTTLFPDLDEIQLSIRIEEVVARFNAELKTADGLKEDLIDNIKLYISSKKLEGLSELTLEDYYRELMLFEYKVNKPTVQINTGDIRHLLHEVRQGSNIFSVIS
jgi:integrase/recombinase XerD